MASHSWLSLHPHTVAILFHLQPPPPPPCLVMLIRNVTYWSSIFITYIILLGSLSGCVVVIQVTWRFPPPVPDRTHASFTPSGNLESANVHVQCFWFVGGNQNYLEKTHIGKGKTRKLPIEFLSVGFEPITFLLYSPLFSFTKIIIRGNSSSVQIFKLFETIAFGLIFSLWFFRNIVKNNFICSILISCDISEIKENYRHTESHSL